MHLRSIITEYTTTHEIFLTTPRAEGMNTSSSSARNRLAISTNATPSEEKVASPRPTSQGSSTSGAVGGRKSNRAENKGL